MFHVFGLLLSSSGRHNHDTHSTNNVFSKSPSIAVCCAWDNKFANGQLTYTIVGGDAPSRQAVTEAINEWESSVNGLQFTEVSDKNSANIVVNFHNVGAGSEKHTNGLGSIKGSTHTDIVGETVLHGSSNGLIDSAEINLATGAFGSTFGTTQIRQIAMHEIGHALGIGHANFVGDIMAPAINYEKAEISKCDANAVLAANQWEFEGSSNIPLPPQTNHIEC
jgi:predicted Zn-dependent protease